MNPSERVSPISLLNEQIKNQLKKSPDGPDYTQSSLKFTHDNITLAITKIATTLQEQFPIISPELKEWSHSLYGRPHRSRLEDIYTQDDDGTIYVKKATGEKYKADPLNQALFHADPSLGKYDYISSFYVGRNQAEKAESYYPLKAKFERLLEAANIKPDSPQAKILALGYFTQVVKNKAVDESKELLSIALNFGGFAKKEGDSEINTLNKVATYIGNIDERAKKVHVHRDFLARGKDAIEKVAKEAGYTPEHIELLMDLAFTAKSRSTKDIDLLNAIETIADLVGQNTEEAWNEAFALRNFLLKYVSIIFPEWRSRQHQSSTEEQTYERLREVQNAIVSGEINLEEINVPEKYRPGIESMFLSAKERRQQEVLKSTTKITESFIANLLRSTKLLLIEDQLQEINSKFSTYFESIMNTTTISLQKKLSLLEWAYKFTQHEIPDEISDKIQYILSAPVLDYWGGSKIDLRIPERVPIGRGEITYTTDRKMQAFVQPTKTQVEREGVLYNSVSLPKVNVAPLLAKVITASYQEYPGRLRLPTEKVLEALFCSFRESGYFKKQGENYVPYITPDEYIRALVSTIPDGELIDENSIETFIKKADDLTTQLAIPINPKKNNENTPENPLTSEE